MGTRGVWGMRYKNEDKITYNHFDSYPEALGKTIQEFCLNHSVEELKECFERIILVNGDSTPTKSEIKECQAWLDLEVSNKSEQDWYCLLRNSQGEPESYFKGLKYMIDSKDFLKDSLFCEWGYVINLDEEVLEVYEGFQKEPQDNRYKIEKPEDGQFYNYRLLKVIPLKELKDFNMLTLEEELNESV